MPREPLPRRAKEPATRLLYLLTRSSLAHPAPHVPRDGGQDYPPAYQSMLVQAILSSDDPRGASIRTIKAFISATYPVPPEFRRHLNIAIKRLRDKALIAKKGSCWGFTAKGKAKFVTNQRRNILPKLKKHKPATKAGSRLKSGARRRKRALPAKALSRGVLPANDNLHPPPASPPRSSYPFHWQFLGRKTGWHDYDVPASDTVEQVYQDYLKNPAMCDVRAIKSGEWMYQVDFVNMKQTNIQHEQHTARQIRRVPW